MEFFNEKERTPPGLDSHVYSWDLKADEHLISIKATMTDSRWRQFSNPGDAIAHMKARIGEYVKGRIPSQGSTAALEFDFASSGM